MLALLLLGTLLHGPADLATLTASADAVAHAQVVGSESHWANGQIFTTFKLRTIEAWKGSPEPEFRVLVEGGTAGGYVQTVQGVAQFTAGEEVVVFLRKRTLGVYSVDHMALGKFALQGSRALRERRGLTCVGCSQTEPDELPLSELRAQVFRK
jgi:hypothetical protein